MDKTITTNDAIEAYNALNEFAQKDITLPAQVAWDIEDNLEILKKITDKFDQKQSQIWEPLQEENGLDVFENGQIAPKEGFEEEFMKAVQEIDDYRKTKNSINIRTMTRSQLPETLSVKDIKALKFMIVDDNDTAKFENIV